MYRLPSRPRHSPIAENNIRHVPHAFLELRGDEITPWTRNHLPGLLEIAQESVEHVAQPGCRPSHAVRDVQPAFRRLHRHRPGPVFRLFDRMVLAFIDDLLILDHGPGDVITQPPADPTAPPGLNEGVLRASIECILALDEFRVQDDVALLR